MHTFHHRPTRKSLTASMSRRARSTVLRDACGELEAGETSHPGSGVTLLREECRRLAATTQTDPERVWRWAFVERVTTGLYLQWHGHADQAATFLDTATILAREGG